MDHFIDGTSRPAEKKQIIGNAECTSDCERNEGDAMLVKDVPSESIEDVNALHTTRRLDFMEGDGCDDSIERGLPKIGMVFESESCAFKFYNEYARKMGFSVRKGQHRKRASGIVQMKRFLCSKEGFCKEPNLAVVHKQKRGFERTGCNARMEIKLQENGKYYIDSLELQHNHALASPHKVHLLRSHADNLDKAGIRPKNAYTYMQRMAGGRQNLGYVPIDLQNHLHGKRKRALEKGDAGSLLKHFALVQLSLHSSSSGASTSAVFGSNLKKVNPGLSHGRISTGSFKVLAADRDETKQTEKDRWGGLAYDTSDDQQDITRGKGLVDSLFQAPMGDGTHVPIMSSHEYISQGLRQCNFDNTMDGFYISPAFMDKLVVHITKNFMNLPNIKVPLILGIWGGKGQGKSFQCELVFAKMEINPIMMSAGELESGNAGEPAKLIRQRYREAADIIRKGKICCLFINDLDAGAGRMGGTQYTVNNQMVNATLMNIADNPTNVQLPGMYNKQENPRVPIIVTGNDFSTLYAPLIHGGRMEKFYWAPTREDRIGVCVGIFRPGNISKEDVIKLVDSFPGRSIDFFIALRARVYDDEVRKWIAEIGVEKIGKRLVNLREGPPTIEQPKMTLEKLLEYGNMLVKEQENVKTNI